MARTHGKILSSIWHDEDFIARSSAAQRLYMVIVSQGKLNLVGLLDYRPKHLARLAPDTSIDDIEAALEELIEHRFVLTDDAREELLVRSFTRSDPIQMANSKLRKGVWSAWLAIESTALRKEAVWEMPAELFDYPEVPPLAAQIRRSGRMEPATDPATEPPPDPGTQDPTIDSTGDPSATSTSTTTVTSASAARPGPNRPVEKSEPPNPTAHLPRFTADQIEPIDDHERAIGTAIAHEIRTKLDTLLDAPHDDARESA